MKSREEFRVSGLAEPISHYTDAVRAGNLIFVSGVVPVDDDGSLVGGDDVTAQARQVFANLDACLKAAGATFADVVKLTFFVTDIAYLPAIRAARDVYVDTSNPPAGTAVQVVALFSPDALLEVEAYAVV